MAEGLPANKPFVPIEGTRSPTPVEKESAEGVMHTRGGSLSMHSLDLTNVDVSVELESARKTSSVSDHMPPGEVTPTPSPRAELQGKMAKLEQDIENISQTIQGLTRTATQCKQEATTKREKAAQNAETADKLLSYQFSRKRAQRDSDLQEATQLKADIPQLLEDAKFYEGSAKRAQGEIDNLEKTALGKSKELGKLQTQERALIKQEKIATIQEAIIAGKDLETLVPNEKEFIKQNLAEIKKKLGDKQIKQLDSLLTAALYQQDARRLIITELTGKKAFLNFISVETAIQPLLLKAGIGSVQTKYQADLVDREIVDHYEDLLKECPTSKKAAFQEEFVYRVIHLEESRLLGGQVQNIERAKDFADKLETQTKHLAPNNPKEQLRRLLEILEATEASSGTTETVKERVAGGDIPPKVYDKIIEILRKRWAAS